MHMNDALISPAVAGTIGIISAATLAVALKKVKHSSSNGIIPLMGVMGAFIFVAQMINFAIPGTGSSGHIIGAIILAAILGPWAAITVLSTVLIIQCLLFADGGLMALGCNIFNMGILPCLIAYPLLFKPFIRYPVSFAKLSAISVLTCVCAMELGALALVAETTISDITALPMGKFLLFMLPIHIVIGICEGMATATIIYYIQEHQPSLLLESSLNGYKSSVKSSPIKSAIISALAIIILGATAGYLASSLPDGLEWSIENVTNGSIIGSNIPSTITTIQDTTAIMPDYEYPLSGIIGSVSVVVIIFIISLLLKRKTKP